MGNIQGDLSLRDTTESVPVRQLAFLKMADARTHRLWFLWSEGSETSDLTQCGCCGGCLFFDDCIRRPEGRSSSGSSPEGLGEEGLGDYSTPAYNPMAVHALKKVLPLYCITDRECIAHLHQGLLDYTGISDSAQPHSKKGPLSAEGKFYSAPSGRTSPSDSLSSYVSANSSFASLHEEGEEEGKGGEHPGEAQPAGTRKSWRQSKHMSGVGGRWGHRLGVEHTQLYKDFAPVHTNHQAVVYVPIKRASAAGSGPASLHGSPQVNVKAVGSRTPPTRLGAQVSDGPKAVVMRLPMLEHQRCGHLPVVTERQHGKRHKERYRTEDSTVSAGGEESLAKFSLCLSVCDSTGVALSPLLLPVIER